MCVIVDLIHEQSYAGHWFLILNYHIQSFLSSASKVLDSVHYGSGPLTRYAELLDLVEIYWADVYLVVAACQTHPLVRLL